LGKITVARTFMVMNQGPDGIGTAEQGSPPAGLKWDLWLGPAADRPFNPLIVQNAYHNCSFMEFSGGWTPGMAPHIVDLPWWALQLGVPRRTSCAGGRFAVQGDGDAPDTQEVLWEFPQMTLTWSMNIANSFGFDFGRGEPARRLGIYFHGLNGTLFSNYGMHEVVPEGKMLDSTEPPEKTLPSSPGHERQWLDCMRSRQQPSCSVDYHYQIDLAIHLANLAMRLQRTIEYDASADQIVGDPEAARLAKPEYRAPWKFPDQYLPAANA
jgi:hypothetical protein